MTEPYFSAQEKLECVRREIGYRERVFSRRVIDGRMTQQKADREIALMKSIAGDYERMAHSERLL